MTAELDYDSVGDVKFFWFVSSDFVHRTTSVQAHVFRARVLVHYRLSTFRLRIPALGFGWVGSSGRR